MKKSTLRRRSVSMLSLLVCLLMLAMSASAFAAEADTVVDPSTADNWSSLNYSEGTPRTTKNDGRIWTDKSVWKEDAEVLMDDTNKLTIDKSKDSDFLVGLSALSSTMTVDGVTEKPLDIIMVLDVSGSMNESMGYAEVYSGDMGSNGTYYIWRNNRYTQLEYSYHGSQGRRWYYESNGRVNWVTPKSSADDNTSGSVQVYRLVSKMEALEAAVNTFIRSTAEMNSNVTDSSKQHRIALVKFSGRKSEHVGNTTYTSGGHAYNHSQVVKEFAAVTGTTVQSFHSAVESLTPAGATHADYGLEIAENLMGNARSNAQPVVIFFTDGVPTSLNEWDATVADNAVASARNMKDDDAWIYSVGVFDDADPMGDGRLDRYMNAVSSNYPYATGYAQNNMGRKDADGDYYKTAEAADELSDIFENIAEEISGKVAELPTHVEDGYDASKGGYVTFTDTLGAYMEVTSFKSVVYEGDEYKNGVTPGTDNVFVNDTKVINDLGQEVQIDEVKVTIERSDDLAVGDTITVQIPAALIPLAHYDVEINDEEAVTKRTPTTPIRAFYEVSLKDEARELLKNPDADMTAYIAANTDADGKVMFYSNAFDNAKNAQTGSTVATFVPSKMNDMYITVEDTLIFMDEECTEPATRVNENATYYYKRVYYVVSEDPIAPGYEIVSFSGSLLRYVDYDFNEDGQLYVKAGAGRHTRLDAFDTQKTDNKTATAANAAAPRWEKWYEEGSSVSVYLGNNGVLKEAVPGTLAISKKVSLPSWATANPSEKEFEFDVVLKTAEGASLQGSFDAQIKNVSGANDGDAHTVTTDGEGKDTVTLKADQTLYIYGLPAGTSYSVTETDIPSGYKQISPAGSANGTIESGKTSTAAFVNTYSATGTLDGETNLDGSKILTGRDWRPTDVFAFALAPEDENNPMPADAEQIDDIYMSVAKVSGADEDKAFNFGDITYTHPGTYKYEIREVVLNNVVDRVPGISYSQAVYEVTVVVADNGNGTLNVQSTMKLVGADDADATVQSAEFKNVYVEDKVTFGIVGRKQLNDAGGMYELTDDAFTFKLEATDGAPMPAGSVGGVYTTTNKGINIAFGDIECTLSEEEIIDAGETLTYIYKVSEVEGSAPGIQYDENTYEVKVVFTWDATEGLVYDIEYPDGNGWVTFTNTFNPEDAKAVINIDKELTGRDWEDNETFEFLLEGEGGAPMPTEANGNAAYEFAVGENGKELTINYEKPGTYEYVLSEVIGSVGGIQYDTRKVAVTVDVTIKDGALHAAVLYDDKEDVPTFVNKYESDLMYPGITVTKTLLGRDMAFGEFDFVIEPVSDVAIAKGVASSDSNFESGAHAAGDQCTMPGKLSGLVFTQADSGKKFIYKVYEVLPEDDDRNHDKVQKNGVTYDDAVYYVVITPTDNGNGTMSAETKVYADENLTDLKNSWSTENQVVPEIGFTNSYGSKEVTVDTSAGAFFTKILKGRDWADYDTFEFRITGEDGAPMPVNDVVTVGKPASGNSAVVNFGSITFTEEGTYKYKVTEVKGDDTYINYDTHVATLTVRVTDNGRGNLVAATSVENGVFTNIYSFNVFYEDVTELYVTKSLTGRELRDLQFTFNVVPLDIPSMNKAGMQTLDGIRFRNGAPGEDGISHMFSPDNLKFTEDDLGITYSYTFSEVNDGVAGYTYDANVYTLKFTADYEDGQIIVTTEVLKGTEPDAEVFAKKVAYDGINSKPVVTIPFKNSYAPEATSVVVEGTKEMTGRELVEGEFEFALAYSADNEKTAIETATNGVGGVVNFGELTYTLEELNKLVSDGYAARVSDEMTDTYTISYIAYEKAGDSAGVTHTAGSFDFTVTVTDDGKGQLVSVVNYPEGGLAFKNTYSTGEEPVSLIIKGHKNLIFEEGLTPDSIEGKFTFELTAQTEGAPMPQVTKVTNDALGNVVFESIEFSMELLNDVEQVGKVRTKEFVYTVTESGTVEGVTNDPVAEKTFSITLIDDGEGHLNAVENPQEGPMFTFTNTYTVKEVTESMTGEGNLTVTKKLNGRDMKDGEFTFELVEGQEVVAEGSNNADGTVTFESITYDKVGTHLYTVREVQGEAGGVTYDKTTYQVKAVVTDNGKGQLDVEFGIVGEGIEAIVFTNEYDPNPASLTVAPGKSLEGRDLIDGEFNFKMTAVTENAPMPVKDVVANDAEGKINFGEITYEQVGTYEYTIAEIKGEFVNITYDETVHNMKVVVTDNGKGQLEARVTYDGKDEVPVFENKYTKPKVTESITGEGNLTVTKKLNGRGMTKGEFTFELVEGQEVVAEGANNADGTVTFGSITYNEVGTHLYTVREVQGDAVGVTYDKTTYQVKAVVTDNGKGQLDAEFGIVDEDIETIEFINEYKPMNATLTVIPEKTLEGRELIDGEFNFKMTAVTENAPMPVKDVVANDAEGKINFGEITYEQVGTYKYTIAEIKGDVENITYDGTVHNMKVVVTDNGKGQLEVRVTYDGKDDAPVFMNKYHKPVKPTDPGVPDDISPDTGDDMSVVFYLLMAVTCLIVAVYCIRRKRAN